MKKCTLALAVVAALPVLAANAYESGSNVSTEGYYTTRSVKQPASYKKTVTTRKNGGYSNTIQNNFYSSQPAKASSYDVRTNTTQTRSRPTYSSESYDYDGDAQVYKQKQVRTVNKTYSTQERKFFLAHPFFQPLKGKFGSVTDVSYATNNFKFDMLNGVAVDVGSGTILRDGPLDPMVSGKAETTQLAVKEDFSFGLSDTVAVIGMLQYDRTEVSFKDWSGGEPGTKTNDSGLNIFGIGLQSRFVDSNNWIAMLSGYFQHQRDVANTFIGELKVGYKIDRTTVYGLLRGGYSVLTKGDAYGAYTKESNGDWLMLSYKTDVKDIFYIEGGMGAFAVLNKYFTLNGELIYGHYDWHEQLSIKGAIGWQPGDMFALNLYGSTALYDSAKNKTKDYMHYEASTNKYTTGDYKIKDYNEWKVGIQAILYF